MKHKIKGYGWIPDLPNIHDCRLVKEKLFEKRDGKPLPSSTSNRISPYMPPIWDQGNLGSCTAHAAARLFEFEARKQGLVDFSPSRLLIYYDSRAMEHTIKQDAGAQVRDAIASLTKYGACPEELWPYVVSKFAKAPPTKARRAAKKNLALSTARVPRDAQSMKAVLASEHLIDIGFTVYESFESDQVSQTGILQLPKFGEEVEGGHSVAIADYDDSLYDGEGGVIIANSWGDDWGQEGYFTMPWTYLLNSNLSDDFWCVTEVVENS